MEVLTLRTVRNTEGYPLGQKPYKINLCEKTVQLITKQYISEAEFKRIKHDTGRADYVVIEDEIYKITLYNGKLIKLPAELFTAEEGQYHILLGRELEMALKRERLSNQTWKYNQALAGLNDQRRGLHVKG